ncbi:NAD(P)-dependent oxidoreductase [Jiella sp. MQZ13P-4]|uniref:NAD(P)-dependent oxidoreductase n=2 Tax=Jiella sonneratiae TaxID=2816856 RepID=A0ABS3J8Q0_9HYPH|nr:NAD(P)-dependent oxidoreductase [Jiella sonneratiae]
MAVDGEAIALIGYGEAAAAITGGWPLPRKAFRAYDVKTREPVTAEAMWARYEAAGIAGCGEIAEAIGAARLVLSLVTADRAVEAAGAGAPHLTPGALFIDGNSCSPASKSEAARLVEAAGGRYVDMAIMAPVHPKGHRVPVLLAGPHAEDALAVLTALDMDATLAGPEVGQASAIKMLRSVMVKGFEALTAECLLAARRAGVEDAVLASLQASDPGTDWRARSAYNLERMMVHGVRRAAEMEEVGKTVAALGLPPRMSAAIAAWQRQVGSLALEGGAADLAERADRLNAGLGSKSG